MGVIVLAVLVQKFSEIVVLGRPYLRPHPRRPGTPAGHANDEFGRCSHGPVPEVPVLGHPLGPVLWSTGCGGLIHTLVFFWLGTEI